MTQEEKQLLLTDLCARLPYGVKGHYKYYDIVGGRECLTDENDGNITSIDVVLGNPIKINGYYTEVEYVKPYLRPMSSMTKGEKDEYNKTKTKIAVQWDDYGMPVGYEYAYTIKTFDWLNSHHFDFRGLISMGLALEATEGMNKTK